MLQAQPISDFTKRNGTGGESIYGAPFADEDLSRPVDEPGSEVPFAFIAIANFSRQVACNGKQGS